MATRLPQSKTVIARLALEAPMVLESAGMSRSAIAAQLVHRRKDFEATLSEELARTAILSGDEEFALQQVARCSNVDAADNLGVTLLHHAAQKGMLKVAEALLERQANTTAVTALGEPILSYVIACNGDPEQPRNHMVSMLRLLLREGARADQPDAVDKTLPEQVAARVGDTSALAVLYGALKQFQRPTLAFAAMSGFCQPVRFLLWTGTDPRPDLSVPVWPRGSIKDQINTETFDGRKMKEQAELLARAEAIAYARQRAGWPVAGADLTQIPNLLKPLQDVALIMRGQGDLMVHDQAMRALGEMHGYKPFMHGSAQELLLRGAATNHIPMMRGALAKGAIVDAQNEYGRTAVAIAAIHTQLEALDLLHRVQANPDITDVLGRTPLMYNALAGNMLSVGKLLTHGANPLLTAPEGKTARELVNDLTRYLAAKSELAPEQAEEYEVVCDMLIFAEQQWLAADKPKVVRKSVRPILH